MDTITKGNAFEDIVYELIRQELESGGLGLLPSQAKMFKKKGYQSKDRDSQIILDITIELWPADSKSYSILWVCECKDYGTTIPVSDVEEFKAKLDQIAGKNVKGVIASRNALQKGALTYARSNGIGVVRILPDDQVDWTWHLVSTLRRLDYVDFAQALASQNHRGHNRAFYSTCDGSYFEDWHSLVLHQLKEGWI